MKSILKIPGTLLIILSTVYIAAFSTSSNQKLNSEPEALLLKNATVINPKSKTSRKQDLLIASGKIKIVSDQIDDNKASKTIDLEGKFILPGFIDSHVHPFGNAGAIEGFEFLGMDGTVKRALQSGVIAVLDVFSDEAENFDFRNNQNNNLGADFYTSGSCFTATNGHCTEYGVKTRTIDTPEQASQSVSDLIKNKKPDVIKIVYDSAYAAMPTIDEDTMRAAVEAASRFGVKTMIHIGTWENAINALKAGASSITHTYCTPIPNEVVELMVRKNAFFIPTLVVQKEVLAKVEDSSLWSDQLAKRVIPSNILNEYLYPDKFNQSTKGFLQYQKECAGHLLESVKKASNAGVKILTGTDIPNSGTFVGYSVHREMDYFAEAGIDSWEILRSSTTYGSEFLDENFGVEAGDIASLVILNRSPLEGIGNTKDIYQVIHHGNLIELTTVKQ